MVNMYSLFLFVNTYIAFNVFFHRRLNPTSTRAYLTFWGTFQSRSNQNNETNIMLTKDSCMEQVISALVYRAPTQT